MDLELHFAADAISLLPATRARLRNDKSARPGFGRTSRVISDIVKRRSIRAQCAAQKAVTRRAISIQESENQQSVIRFIFLIAGV
jgi:hypothetical protein